MLQVKSFKISDGEGISEFLQKYRIAEGGSMLISDGEIALPYEDGAPMNKAQKGIFLKEQINVMQMKKDIILHSNKVMEIEIKGIFEQIEKQKALVVDGAHEKLQRETNTAAKKEIERLQNMIDQKNNQLIMNNAELTNMAINIAVWEESIAQLEQEG